MWQRRGVCGEGGMRGKGVCMVKGACMTDGMHGRGHAWQRGACIVRGACMAGAMRSRGACIVEGAYVKNIQQSLFWPRSIWPGEGGLPGGVCQGGVGVSGWGCVCPGGGYVSLEGVSPQGCLPGVGCLPDTPCEQNDRRL